MNIKQCYEAAGGDFDEIISRFLTEQRVAKFAVKFLNDPSYENLVSYLEEGNFTEAFRAAHTLKGVAQNLAFTDLHLPTAELTELLRPCEPVDTSALMEKITAAYNKVVAAVRAYEESNN